MTTEFHHISLLADLAEAVPVLAEWICRTWPQDCDPGPDAAARQISRWCGRDSLPMALIACDPHGAPLGFAGLVPGLSPQRQDIVLLSTLLVVPLARRRGIGRSLCTEARVRAAQLGVPVLHLYTLDRHAFFRLLGWRLLSHAIVGAPNRPRGAAFMQIDTAATPTEEGHDE